MNIVPYKAEHMARIEAQDAQRYVGGQMSPEYARALENGLSFAALDGDVVLGVGGAVEIWTHRGLLWTYLDRRAGNHFLAIHRAARRFIELAPFKRLEAEVDCEFEPAHRWVRMLGFVLEAPRMRAFQVTGSDSALYARVKSNG